MTKTFLLAAAFALAVSPALSQSSSRSDDRGSTYDRSDRDGSDRDRDRDRGWWREGRGWHHRMHHDDDDRDGRRARGARFMVRSGESAVAVRCDQSESMRACVDATLTLLDRVRSPSASGGSGAGSGPAQPPR